VLSVAPHWPHGTAYGGAVADVVFVGVTTGSSLAHQALACWQPLLGVGCGLRGINIAVDARDNAYLDLLDELQHDNTVIDAVVTTHKLRLFQVGRTRFDRLDPVAVTCEEINAIRRHSDGSLHGWARDPVSVGRVVDRIWPQHSGTVICLGAGGTAVALTHHLFTTRSATQFVCADPNPDAAARLTRIAGRPVISHIGSGPWDELISAAQPASLIVNATGLGKDRPGSPASRQVRLPTSSVVWDLNYRGDLRFLDLAREQSDEQQLDVHDGWELFCHGWAAALTVVLGLSDDADLGRRFLDVAHDLRPTRK
jgi:shikimate 5-dehydrogenase